MSRIVTPGSRRLTAQEAIVLLAITEHQLTPTNKTHITQQAIEAKAAPTAVIAAFESLEGIGAIEHPTKIIRVSGEPPKKLPLLEQWVISATGEAMLEHIGDDIDAITKAASVTQESDRAPTPQVIIDQRKRAAKLARDLLDRCVALDPDLFGAPAPRVKQPKGERVDRSQLPRGRGTPKRTAKTGASVENSEETGSDE